MVNSRLICAMILAGLGMPTPGRAVDYRLLPPNTEIVVTINVKQILDSELVKGLPQAINQGKEATKHLKQMGFDPFHDLTSITIASPGLEEGPFGPFELFILMDTVVDPAKFSAIASRIGDARKSKLGTLDVYEFSAPTKKKIYAAHLGGTSVVLAAEEEALKEAIARSKGNQIAATKVKHYFKTANDKQSLSFALSGAFLGKLVSKIERDFGSKGQFVTKYMTNIEGLSGAFTITKEINFQFSAVAKDEKAAEELASFGSGGLLLLNAMLGGQQDPDQAPLLDVVRTLKVSSAGTQILLTGKVSAQNCEKFAKVIENWLK